MAENQAGKITGDTKVNTTELAAVLGITARRVQQLVQDGNITQVKRGKFEICEAVQQYISFLAKGRDQTSEDLEKGKLAAEASIKKSKSIIEDLKVRELQGSMHRAEDVEVFVSELVYGVRGMLLALPGRLAVDAAGSTDPAEVSEIVRKEVYAVMEDLAQYQYDSQKYKDRVRERMKWEAVEYMENHEDDG